MSGIGPEVGSEVRSDESAEAVAEYSSCAVVSDVGVKASDVVSA